MLNSDQVLALLRQTQALSRHKQGSQQGFVSIMCPFSTLTEIWKVVCILNIEDPNIHYFNFLVYCLVIIIEMGHDLGSNNIQKNGEREVLQNYQDDNGNGLRKETIYFDF